MCQAGYTVWYHVFGKGPVGHIKTLAHTYPDTENKFGIQCGADKTFKGVLFSLLQSAGKEGADQGGEFCIAPPVKINTKAIAAGKR